VRKRETDRERKAREGSGGNKEEQGSDSRGRTREGGRFDKRSIVPGTNEQLPRTGDGALAGLSGPGSLDMPR
jgi:hypothetical protein